MSFPDGMDSISRRRFLTLLSASASLALGTSCSRVDRGSIVPYTKRPGEIIPGVANYYASTFQEGVVAHGVLVKTREGRPIHIEGNPDHSVSQGKTSLRAIGDLLGLYDPDRLRAPLYKGAPATWEDAVKALSKALADARLMEKPVLFLTNSLLSPTQRALLYDLKLALPGLRHAAWEPALPQPELAASASLYGKSFVHRSQLDRADVILSLQSDFLGVDGNASAFIRGFASRRATSQTAMNRLWALEGSMTLTGANADQRLMVMPSKLAGIGFAIAGYLRHSRSLPIPAGMKTEDFASYELDNAARDAGLEPATLKILAEDLGRAGKSAIVLAGPSLPPEAHVAARLLNFMLGAEGNTSDMNAASLELASFSELKEILGDAERGKYAVGIFWATNPAYAFPDRSLWKKAVDKIPETYRIGLYQDETALDCAWCLPENHWLESWGDFESAPDFVSLRQPVIGAIHDSRQTEEYLLSCMRKMRLQNKRSYLEYLKDRWRSDVYSAGNAVPFDAFWNAALHDGGAKREPRQQAPLTMNADAIKQALSAAGEDLTTRSDAMELLLSPAPGVYDGRYANNGWLNELPDPVTKSTWGNPVLISISDAERMSLKDGDIVDVSSPGSSAVQAPVLIQPGQSPGVAALALGYGRRTGTVAVGVGTNAYPLIDISSKSPFLLAGAAIKPSKENLRREIPITQTHNRMGGRDLSRSITLTEYSREAGKRQSHHESPEIVSLIPPQQFAQHKWSMVIDLSACTGCSACVIACQSENNVPVVGPERILKGRGMHWIRIDRYYEGSLEDPRVRHQPMLCQHCDHAPCEIVCPVNATTHSPDGLNQMAYNRCVGTRYCSNNCPFKVRRFNYFDYTSMKKEPESLVYNPEVTVRPRGVMEKCTFCIQRIQNAKQNAKAEGRAIAEGEIQPACAGACPAGAIIFGDLNDGRSRVSRLSKTNRSYRLLEELGIRPSVTYLADIYNPAIGKGRA